MRNSVKFARTASVGSAPSSLAAANDIEVNGIIRSTVFPNAVRDVRVAKGFGHLTDFADCVEGVNYTRLGKIERGEVFPRVVEFDAIAQGLGVEMRDLLLDVSSPSFDREEWARQHVVSKLSARDCSLDDLYLGAAMRVRRQALGLSTTALGSFGLPAAMVSRIENAERAFDTWPRHIRMGVRKLFGVRSFAALDEEVAAMRDNGMLDDMMVELFSSASVEDRMRRRLSAFVAEIEQANDNEADKPVSTPAMTGDMVTLFRGRQVGAFIEFDAESGSVAWPDGVGDGFAIEMAQPVLGPGAPEGAQLIFEECKLEDLATLDVVAVIDRSGTRGIVGLLRKAGRGHNLVQVMPESVTLLSSIDVGRIGRLAATL